MLSKMGKRFYLNLLAYVRDSYKNTKSPDKPKELSGNTKLVFQTTLNTMLNYAVKKGLLCGIPSMTQLSEVILNPYTVSDIWPHTIPPHNNTMLPGQG